LQEQAALMSMGQAYQLGPDVLATEVVQALELLQYEMTEKAKLK